LGAGTADRAPGADLRLRVDQRGGRIGDAAHAINHVDVARARAMDGPVA
jgi:hypothetical protein